MLNPKIHDTKVLTSERILGTEKYLRRIISARPRNLRDKILLDQPLSLLGHANPDVLLLVVLTQLHHREH